MKLLIIKETGFKCKMANPPHCISGFVDFSANPASMLFQALINHNSQELIFAAFQQTWLWFFYFFYFLYINLDVLNTNLIIFIFQSSAFTFTERNIHIYRQCLTHCKSGTQIFKPQKKKKKNTVAVKSWFITESLSCAAAPSLRWASDDSLLVYPWSFYFVQYVFVLTRQFARNRCLCQRKVNAVDVI